MPIEDVLPPGAIGVERWAPWDGISLAPPEAAAVAGAGAQRRAQFAAGRDCAHGALRRLGWPEGDLVVGRHDDGRPLWPEGIVGSITHTDRYAAAAVARRVDLTALGVDAEPAEPLPAGVADLVCSPEEVAWACARPAEPWDRLLFSAKESVAKAWAAAHGRLHDLREIGIVVDPAGGTFSARLIAPAASAPVAAGRFAWTGDLVLTAAGIPAR